MFVSTLIDSLMSIVAVANAPHSLFSSRWKNGPVDWLRRVVAEMWRGDSLKRAWSMLEALKFGLIFAVPTIMAVATFVAAARADQRRFKA
jgi:hypothetical protein